MAETRALRNAFWRDLGPGSFAIFLGAVFFTFAPLGFLLDVPALGRPSRVQMLSTTLVTGLVAALYAWCGTRQRRWFPVAILVQIVLLTVVTRPFPDVAPAIDFGTMRQRLLWDVCGTIVCVTTGYALFIVLINREGVSAVRLRTEMALAREIHQSLVPAIDRRVGNFEICGVSIPSGAVGGDLVDFIDAGRGTWIGYVADVSGHGVPAGLLMGMVKSATRTRLLSSTPLASLLDDLNRVIFDVKRPNMFVTFAAVRWTGEGPLEFTLAGHLPLLRLTLGGREVDELSVSQIPLGVIETHAFASAPFECHSGDLIALVTDGLSEVFDRRDREFGLDGIKRVLLELAGRPLPEIRDAVLAQVGAHGAQLDDQTLLLIRRLA